MAEVTIRWNFPGAEEAARAVQGIKDGFERMTKSADSLSAKMKSAGQSINQFGTRMKNAGTQLTLGITAPLAAIGIAAVKSAESVDRAMVTIRSGTGATGKQLDDLRGNFLNLSKQAPQGMNAIAKSLSDMQTITGTSGRTLEGLTKNILDVSRVLGEDATINTRGFATALQQFQIDAEGGSTVMAKLFEVTQTSGVGFGELTRMVNEYGAVLKNAGFSMEESAVLFGDLSKAGISVSRVMPGLNASIRRWAGENRNIQEELVNTVNEIRNTTNETAALNLATKVFGAEGAQRLKVAIKTGALELNNLSERAGSASKSIDEATSDTITFTEKITLLSRRLQIALIPLGEKLVEVFDNLKPTFDLMINLVGSLVDRFTKLSPKVQNAIVIVGGLAAALGPTIAALGFIITGIGTFIAFLGSPWVLAIGGAIAAIVGLIAAIKNFRAIIEFISNLMDKIALNIQLKFLEINKSVAEGIEKLLRLIPEKFRPGFVDEIISGMGSAQLSINAAINSINADLDELSNGFGSSANDIRESIDSGIVEPVKEAEKSVDKLIESNRMAQKSAKELALEQEALGRVILFRAQRERKELADIEEQKGRDIVASAIRHRDEMGLIQEQMGKQIRDSARRTWDETEQIIAAWFPRVRNILQSFMDFTFETWNFVKKSFGDAVAGMVLFGESFADTMRNIFNRVLASFISMLAQMALEAAAAKIAINFGLENILPGFLGGVAKGGAAAGGAAIAGGGVGAGGGIVAGGGATIGAGATFVNPPLPSIGGGVGGAGGIGGAGGATGAIGAGANFVGAAGATFIAAPELIGAIFGRGFGDKFTKEHIMAQAIVNEAFRDRTISVEEIEMGLKNLLIKPISSGIPSLLGGSVSVGKMPPELEGKTIGDIFDANIIRVWLGEEVRRISLMTRRTKEFIPNIIETLLFYGQTEEADLYRRVVFPKLGTPRMLAEGGIINRPTFAMIGESGPEAVIPLSRGGGMGQVNNFFGPVVFDDLTMSQFFRKAGEIQRREQSRYL